MAGRPPRTWLHTICYRAAIDHLRYESRHPRTSLDALPSEPVGAWAEMTQTVDDQLVAADVMARIEPEQRALLYMAAGLGFTFDEVAEITGLNRGTVASRVSRAKDRLRGGARHG